MGRFAALPKGELLNRPAKRQIFDGLRRERLKLNPARNYERRTQRQMKTIEYSFIDKSAWGPGPWQDEPDKVQWSDPLTGLPCLAVRPKVHGSWCAYVGVAEGHPLFGKEDSEEMPLSVHGGITFTDFCVEDDKEHGICHVPDPGEPDRVWWLGFDHGHADDYMPALAARSSSFAEVFDGWVYRDLPYVKEGCADLAAQLKALEYCKSSPEK